LKEITQGAGNGFGVRRQHAGGRARNLTQIDCDTFEFGKCRRVQLIAGVDVQLAMADVMLGKTGETLSRLRSFRT